VYYLYSIIKLFIFNFNKETFYSHFLSSNKLSSLVDILLLKNSDTGIPILFTIGIFLIISPILLYFIRKAKNPNIPVIFAILFFIVLSFIVSPTSSYIYNLLYSNNFAIFPLFLWIIPYLIGALIAINGFEKSKKTIFFTSFIGFTVYSIFFTINNMPINPAIYTYQLSNGSVKFYTYFVLFSFMIISILMYILEYVANMNNAIINKILNFIEFIGDQTFDLYLIQWIVIDITYWIFSSKIWIIFITVLPAMFIYFFIK